jgi:hypothetical protein
MPMSSVQHVKPLRLTITQEDAFRRVAAGHPLNGHAHRRTIRSLIDADLIENSGVGYYTVTSKGEGVAGLLMPPAQVKP